LGALEDERGGEFTDGGVDGATDGGGGARRGRALSLNRGGSIALTRA
jgi:hypothetical protein